MAVLFGEPGEEDGDKKVYKALEALPSECIIYAQPKIQYKYEERHPDYVIVNQYWGVIVLEVKDWKEVQGVNAGGLEVRRSATGKWEHEDCPLDQARKNAYALNNMLAENDELRNYAGKLDFSYTYGVVLPNLWGVIINNCNYHWKQGAILGMMDLAAEKITERIQNIPTEFRVVMTEKQVNAVRASIDAKNAIYNQATGTFKGVLDVTQELITKEDLVSQKVEPLAQAKPQLPVFESLFPDLDARRSHLEEEVPHEVLDLQSNMNVRLVRGFPGTGKTDVLILRAQYLAEKYPKFKILVTTFNKPLCEERLKPELKHLVKQIDVCTFDSLCFGIYKKRNGICKDPQDIRGLLAKLAETNVDISNWGIDFLADEFTWIKESNRTNREEYTTKAREGRGGTKGRVLSVQQKHQLFDLYQKYQSELTERSLFDWADLHEKTLKYLCEGIVPNKNYDIILIDEAQHFAPTWMKIIKKFLKSEGLLFLCDDPSQSMYRFFSWRQKGIEVAGKTRWLRVPYRNTKEIFTAAFSLIANDELARTLLAEDKNYAIPDLENVNLRSGNKPVVRQFRSVEEEKHFILKEILHLIEKGLNPKEICILHTQKYVFEAFVDAQKAGVRVENAINQTGMEYSAIFIPRVQLLNERDLGKGWSEDLSHQHSSTYMMMTRARSYLYMTYQQKWPAGLNSLKEYVDWHELEQGNE